MTCSEIQRTLIESGPGGTIAVGNDREQSVDRHLATCAECRLFAGRLEEQFAAWKSERPWAPPPQYFENLTVRINERIAERESRRRNPFAIGIRIAQWAAAPLAALIVLLVLSNTRTVTPDAAFPTSQEVAAVVNALPDSDLADVATHAQVAEQYAAVNVDSSSLSLTDDDQSELADLIDNGDAELSDLPLSAAPLSAIQTENLATLFASGDELFDTLKPRMEQSFASNNY